MALYAYGEDDYVHAADAVRGKKYWCPECHLPVQVRRSRDRLAHFYHLQTSPQCRLFSKSEDHLVLQLQLQKSLPDGEGEIERPFLAINRVADLAWERRKIVFEIQCSLFELEEAKLRVLNYKEIGYDVVWLLDDRLFNRRVLRPGEAWVRSRGAYYARLQKTLPLPLYYDQFEVFSELKRLKKGLPLRLNLASLKSIPLLEWPTEIPLCITTRLADAPLYAHGDLVDRAIKSSLYPTYACALQYWKTLEAELLTAARPPSILWSFFRRYIAIPYMRQLSILMEKVS